MTFCPSSPSKMYFISHVIYLSHLFFITFQQGIKPIASFNQAIHTSSYNSGTRHHLLFTCIFLSQNKIGTVASGLFPLDFYKVIIFIVGTKYQSYSSHAFVVLYDPSSCALPRRRRVLACILTRMYEFVDTSTLTQ
ncbi:hypothetical protein CPC08DRAFT_27747 [Agrocybe pediades]|nr:hypothetical protein CPC08DRAFT_27747 [Agrocybe pediades]